MVPVWDEMAVVGRVARAHGLRGQVIVNPETDFPGERFRPGAELFVRRGGAIEALTIGSVRFQRDRPVVAFRGLGDVNAAQALAGLELRVPLECLAALPAGTYYRHDLVGCSVVTEGGREVGVVTSVEGSLNGSRLVVGRAGREVLVPLASEICTTIDPLARRIVIAPPDGLLELNE